MLTQKRQITAGEVIDAIDALCRELTPIYLQHTDFQRAKKSFSEGMLDDLEDLMVLHSALRTDVQTIITNDQRLLQLKHFENLSIKSP